MGQVYIIKFHFYLTKILRPIKQTIFTNDIITVPANFLMGLLYLYILCCQSSYDQSVLLLLYNLNTRYAQDLTYSPDNSKIQGCLLCQWLLFGFRLPMEPVLHGLPYPLQCHQRCQRELWQICFHQVLKRSHQIYLISCSWPQIMKQMRL